MKTKSIILMLAGSIVVAAVLILTKIAIDNNNHNIKEYAEIHLRVETEKMAKSIGLYMQGRHENIRVLSELYANEPTDKWNSNDLNSILKNIAENSYYKDIIISDAKGIGIDIKGRKQKLDFCSLYHRSLSGEAVTAYSKPYENSDDFFIIDSVPIIDNNIVKGVIRTVTDIELLKNKMSLLAFQGNEEVFLLTRDGDIIISDTDLLVEDNNITTVFDLDDDGTTSLIQVINQGRSTLTDIKIKEEKYYVSYQGVNGIGNWGVMVAIPMNQLISLYSNTYSYELNSVLLSKAILAIVAILTLMAISVATIRRAYRLERIAFYDGAINNMNFNSFRLSAMETIEKNNSDNVAVIQMAVSKFDYIREFFGLSEIRRIQKHIAGILRANMQGDEIFCRYSSKYFNLLLIYHNREELTDRIKHLNDKLLNLNQDKNSTSKYEFILNYGIYLVNHDDNDIEYMVDKANQALLRVKEDRNSLMKVFSSSMYDRLLDEKEIEEEMHKAIEKKELIVYLQPKYDMNTGLQVGAEALVRWLHPEKGLLYPKRFIEVFEKKGFMGRMDMYMLEQMCSMLSTWTKKGYRPMPLSLNISRINLYNPDFTTNVLSIVEANGISPHLLIFEIAENTIVDNMEIAGPIIEQFQKYGFKVSLDNFGTGTTSMNTLYRISVDELKLDRRYILESEKTDRGIKLIQSIIKAAKSLNIKVVSEGVENKKQARQLKQMGCDMLQGFVFSEPLPAAEYEEYAYGPGALDNRINV